MATKTKPNMFAAAARQRHEEQQDIEAAVTGRAVPATAQAAPVQAAKAMDPPPVPLAASRGSVTAHGKIRKRGANATTLTLSVSAEDRDLFKAYAAANCMSASDLLHKWIVENCDVQ